MCQVTEWLKRLAQHGYILFVVTHDYEFLNRACNCYVRIDKINWRINEKAATLNGQICVQTFNSNSNPHIDRLTGAGVAALIMCYICI